jgi:hypothetical protein
MFKNRVHLLGLGSLIVGIGSQACDASPGRDPRELATTEKVGISSSAAVVSGLFTTGVDAVGAVRTPANGTLRDIHYELVATTDPSLVATLPMPPYIVQPDGKTSEWTANTATGEWISAFATTRAGPIAYTYTYQTTFTIPAGVDPTKVVLSGAWACDDECTLTLGLNGPVVAVNSVAVNGTPPSKPWPFAIPEGTFTSRSVTLDFVVDNTLGFETGLLVTEYGGCTLDSQCRSTEFCDTQNGPCVNKLVNGAPVPTLTGHTPPLTGTCPSAPDAGAAVGSAVCASEVCDPSNGECGLANGHGPCTAGTICQSGVCDSDGLCGFPDGQGPCGGTDAGTDAGPGAVVCRSGICNSLGTCGGLPEAGSDAEADAAGEAQADASAEAQADATGEAQADAAGEAQADAAEQAQADAAEQAQADAAEQAQADAAEQAQADAAGETQADAAEQAQADAAGEAQADAAEQAQADAAEQAQADAAEAPDTAAEAGALVDAEADVSTVTDAGSPVRAGCTVDSDCPGTDYCDTPSSTCVPKLPNGKGVPSAVGHDPALTGTCAAGVGAAVCISGVCDAKDNACGYANGDGPCTAAQASVCRSGTCLPAATVCGDDFVASGGGVACSIVTVAGASRGGIGGIGLGAGLALRWMRRRRKRLADIE